MTEDRNMGIIPIAEQGMGILPDVTRPVKIDPMEMGKNIIKNKVIETVGRKVGLPQLGQLIGLSSFYSSPLGMTLLGPLGFGIAALGGGIKNRFDQYKQKKETQKIIQKESVKDLQDRINKGQFGSNTPTPQDDRRGGQYEGGGGGMSANQSTGTSAERGAALHG